MKYYVSADAEREGCGSQADPFRTISAAAAAAKAGDEVIVAAGVYRESVDPRRGGTGEDNRIIYCSEEPGKAVITGAEQVKGWRHYQGDVWTARIPNGIFNGYNPYTTFVRGDWYMTADPVHTGEIYLNGKAMYESTALDGVLQPEIYRASWDPGFTKHKWYTEQDGDVTVLYVVYESIQHFIRGRFYEARFKWSSLPAEMTGRLDAFQLYLPCSQQKVSSHVVLV